MTIDLKDIVKPDPFVFNGVRFIFRVLPEKVTSLNQLPAMCLSVLQQDNENIVRSQAEFRLYVSTEIDGPMANQEELDEEALDRLAEDAAANMIVHLQQYYGVNASIMADTPIGAMTDEHTIATILACVFGDLYTVSNPYAGNRLTLYHDPKNNVKGLTARFGGTGRWNMAVYSTEEFFTNHFAFVIEGQLRMAEGFQPQPFSLTSTRFIHPLLPQEIIEQWLDEESLTNFVKALFRQLYEVKQTVVRDVKFTSTYANLTAMPAMIDRRTYEVE